MDNNGAGGAGTKCRHDVQLHRLAQEILRHDAFFLLLHLDPDGDSVGSSLALAHALQQRGRTAQVAYVDYLPDKFCYLPGAESIVHWSELSRTPGAALICDCSNLERIGEGRVLVEQASAAINIDHHPDNSHFGAVNYVDPTAAAVGEIVYELLPYLKADLTEAVALPTYVALTTDTGGFRYENTTSRTHRIAADLIDAGVAVTEVTRRLYESKPQSAMRMLGRALASLHVHESLPVAWMAITREDIQKAQARREDLDSVVNYARSIDGVEVGFLVQEESEKVYKVSLRSATHVDVGRLAAEFGGGGHAKAAGCRIEAPNIEAAVQQLLESTRVHLERTGDR